MPCKYIRFRAKDIGRKGYHYIRIGVKKTPGVPGGYTVKIGSPKKYKKRRR